MSEQTSITTSGFALSPQQHHLWSLHGNAARTAYQAKGRIWLEGPLDPVALERALDTLVSQHEILRTVFRCLPSMSLPLQVILPASAPQLSHHDWRERNEADQRTAFSQLCAAIDDQPLPWETGPLLRATLVTLRETQHCLLLHVPALYADALGMVNLGRALAAAYSGEATDEPVQYADVAGVLNDVLVAPESEPGRAYWQQHVPPAISTPLPFEQPAPVEAEFSPQVLTTTLTAEQAERLAALAEAQDSSLPVLLLAAWKILLWHLTREPEIVVATAYDGRVYEGLESVIGVFERHLPVPTALTDEMAFPDVLRAVEQSTTAVADWQEYYTGAQTPLALAFDFVQQPEPLTAGNICLRMEPPQAYTSRFNLKLLGVQSDQGVALQLHYDSTLLSADTTARLADQLHTLLANIAAQPNSAIGDLEVVSQADRDLLHSFNQTTKSYPSQATLHQLFEAQAEATPDRVAVAYGNQHLTFGELNARANQLAHFLQRQGVGVEARVGLCLPRSIEMLVGVLGILKAGGAYVPLDPTYPVERLRYMLDESQVAAVITQEALREHLPAHVPSIALDTQQQQIAQEPATNPQIHVQPEHLAYIIYTSGSTGRPKGVMVQQRNVVNLATALQHAIYAQLQPELRISMNAPLVFDGSVKQWIQVLRGHTIVIVPEEIRLSGAQLCTFIRDQQLDVLDCTPTQLRELLAAGLPVALRPAALLVGGEPLDETLWTRLASVAQLRTYNVYGPTETTVDAAICSLHESATPTIGRAIANVRCYVLDRRGNLLPPGVAGELYIGGAGVAQGYVARPDLTAERFVPDPFSGEQGMRLYRTGDRARYLPDGRIEFLGRVDTQVKLRGLRIELGEIEAILQQHPAVQQAVVSVSGDTANSAQLVAYVLPRSAAETGNLSTELRSLLRQTLPEFMVPGQIVSVKSFTLTPSGKVDRRQLPSPASLINLGSEPYVAPTTPTERLIAEVWQELLHVERVGIHDNFFDLGAHSLLVTQAYDKLTPHFDRNFNLIALFQYPTVSKLAQHLSQAQTSSAALDKAEARAQKQKAALERQQQLGRRKN